MGVECQLADHFAGCGVDDADVEAVDEENNGGSFEGSSEADFVHFSVEAQCDASVVDAVVSDADLGFLFLWDGCCFGSCRVGGCGCGCVGE